MGKKIISLEVTTELKEALRIEAFKQNLSTSALIRKIIAEKLNISLEDTTGDRE